MQTTNSTDVQSGPGVLGSGNGPDRVTLWRSSVSLIRCRGRRPRCDGASRSASFRIGPISEFGFQMAYLVAGSLADLDFEPLMTQDCPPCSILGVTIGLGQRRGISMIVALAGFLTLISAMAIEDSASVAAIEPQPASQVGLEALPC